MAYTFTVQQLLPDNYGIFDVRRYYPHHMPNASSTILKVDMCPSSYDDNWKSHLEKLLEESLEKSRNDEVRCDVLAVLLELKRGKNRAKMFAKLIDVFVDSVMRKYTSHLTHLNLSGNDLRAKDIERMWPVIGSFKILNLSNTKIDPTCVEKLVPVLTDMNNLVEELDLSHNEQLGDGIVHALIPILLHPCAKLTRLDISYNRLRIWEMKKLVEEVLMNPDCSLTDLDLGHNNLDLDWGGAMMLKPVLQLRDSRLVNLSLAGNGLSHDGISIILKGLQHMNCCIDELNLSDNIPRGEMMDDKLIPDLNDAEDLVNLDFRGNGIKEASKEKLRKWAHTPDTHRFLACGHISPTTDIPNIRRERELMVAIQRLLLVILGLQSEYLPSSKTGVCSFFDQGELSSYRTMWKLRRRMAGLKVTIRYFEQRCEWDWRCGK